MFIAKIENQNVIELVDCRDVFGRENPTDERLKELKYLRVNLFREHDALTQKLIASEPVIEGDWVYTVAVAEMTEDDIKSAKESALANIRAQRNQLLSLTDWRYRRDLTTSQEWDDYCQALRDLPQTIADSAIDPRTFKDWPHDPNWVDTSILGA